MVNLLTDLGSRTAAGLFGFALFIATTMSLMRTVVIPRALRSVIADTVQRGVVGYFTLLARTRRAYPSRDGVMAWAGPTTILAQLIAWLVLYLLAFGLLIYGVSGQGLGDSLRQSGSSLFTLGFATIDRANQTVIDFAAAATGPIVVALMIGFLPTIYGAYVDREESVTMLATLAGEPSWGPEILARAHMSDSLEELSVLYRDWSVWAVQTRTTHITYQILVWVRSVRYSRHYLVALLAVLDAAALQAALSTRASRREVFDVLLQGSQLLSAMYVYQRQGRSLRSTLPFDPARRSRVDGSDIARASGWSRDSLATEIAAYRDIVGSLPPVGLAALKEGIERPLTLTREDFDSAVEMLQRADFPIDKNLDVAWAEFQQSRRRYEFPALQLAYLVDATPAPWSGSRRTATPTMWPTLAADVDITHGDFDLDAPAGDPDGTGSDSTPE